jgi:dolichol-phosphate mannosyltransferase
VTAIFDTTMSDLDVEIVIPTRHEEDAIGALIERLMQLVPGARVRVIDDSDNQLTVDAVRTVAFEHPLADIVVEQRPPGHRTNQLAGAVTWGIDMAKPNTIIVVMDGDGQHPPQTIPLMLGSLVNHDADIVVASRYMPGGNAAGLDGSLRHIVSRGCTLFVRALFPRALRGISDPMTGCFVVRRDAIDLDKLQAGGFKILLELLVQHPKLRRLQVPMQFAKRTAGQSNADMATGRKFLVQVFRLLKERTLRPLGFHV